MDWQLLFSALGGASAIAIGLALFLRRSIERLLEVKLKEVEERHKVQLAEVTRRQAAIFDQQLGPLRTLLSLVYQLRNSAKTLAIVTPGERRSAREECVRFASEITHLIIENKAILPSEIWKIAHITKGSTNMFLGSKLRDAQDVVPDAHEDASSSVGSSSASVYFTEEEMNAYLEDIEGMYQKLSQLTLDYLQVK
jgi:hypothetical protein